MGAQDGSPLASLPAGFPSASTCWRRLVEWEEEGVLDDLWIAFLDTLDEQGTLRWNEVFLDATFFPAKIGGTTSGPPSEAKAQSWFWWRMAETSPERNRPECGSCRTVPAVARPGLPLARQSEDAEAVVFSAAKYVKARSSVLDCLNFRSPVIGYANR